MRGRVIGAAVLTAVLGLGGGGAAAYVVQPSLDSTGTATPLAGDHPTAPGFPVTPTQAPPLPDSDYPTLVVPAQFVMHNITNGSQAWRYAVPKGWSQIECLTPDLGYIDAQKLKSCVEPRFRPAAEDTAGGYSLRVKALVGVHDTTAGQVATKLFQLRNSVRAGSLRDLVVIRQDDRSLYLSLQQKVEGGYVLRYNFFRWFAAPGSSTASLEMSVTGRTQDQDGLYGLFDAFASRLQPVS